MNDPESVADHSYRTALMAMVYSDARGLDTARVLKMALIHDLPEAIVGDSIPGERTKKRKLKLESTAMKEILEKMPPAQRREYGMIWQEFNSGESEEALLVRQVDKLEMAVQASEYRSAHQGPGTEEFIESARAGIRDPDLLALLRLVSERD
jgi:putative hydrolases of HD superfamily